MFLETSALVAILALEEDAAEKAGQLAEAQLPITGAHVVLESAMVLSREQRVEPSRALARIETLLEEAKVGVVPLTHAIARIAVDAFSRYGKGRGHPAQLNFGDCLSYACAKHHGVSLLFKGADFAATDVEPA